MLRRGHRAVCNICKRSLPRAAARCPWCSYGSDEPAKNQHSTTSGQHAPAAADEVHASSGEFPQHNPIKEAFA